MKRKEYRLRYRLPDEITDVVPDLHLNQTDVAVMHCHDFYEIEVFLDGNGTEILNGRSYPLQRGRVTLMSPMDFHALIPQDRITFYNFMFRGSMLTPELLHSVWEQSINRTLVVKEEELQEMISLCKLLDCEHGKRHPDRQVFMKNIMECFFILLQRQLHQTPEQKTKAIADTIQNGVLYLHRHYRENPSLAQTAAAVNLHPNYFSQRFREVTGQTYTSYLTNLKVIDAKKLLLSSKLSVTEICFASGFTSLSNFMKIFKSHTGMSPRQFVEASNTYEQL